jgi:hypothetical protein
MFRTRALVAGLCTVAAAGLLAGCGSPVPKPPDAAQRSVRADDGKQPMAAGMTMPDGSIMGAASAATTSVAAGPKPSAAAAMICSTEIRHDLAEALAITSVPAASRTYGNSLLTCTYPLSGGHLVLSVKDLPGSSATNAYFTARRRSLPQAHMIEGLTPGAVTDGAGIVLLRKDDHVLTVDSSAMPAVFGTQHNKRADFAFEVASVILGCWTGD